MFIIYNETKTAWDQESRNGVEFLSKTRTYNKDGKYLKDSIGIITYTNLTNDNINKIGEFKVMGQPRTIIPDSVGTSVQFNKKEFNPFVTEGTKGLKDIYLISLDLKGRKIVGLSESIILDRILLGGEFSAVIAVKPNLSFKIYLADEDKNERITYVFKKNNQGVLDLKVLSKTRTEEEKERAIDYKPRRFRPASCTQTVLVHESKSHELANTLGEELLMKKWVYPYNDTNLEDVLKKLVEEKIKAVTIFDDSNVNDLCCQRMNVVYNMDKEKMIKKIKF